MLMSAEDMHMMQSHLLSKVQMNKTTARGYRCILIKNKGNIKGCGPENERTYFCSCICMENMPEAKDRAKFVRQLKIIRLTRWKNT